VGVGELLNRHRRKQKGNYNFDDRRDGACHHLQGCADIICVGVVEPLKVHRKKQRANYSFNERRGTVCHHLGQMCRRVVCRGLRSCLEHKERILYIKNITAPD